MITPIHTIKLRGSDNNIFIKREDLIPFSFGGNKVRIAEEYFFDLKQKNKDCIIAYGNPKSNLCRIVSNMAFEKGIPCYIVSPTDDEGNRQVTNNSRLTALSNAHIIPCDKTNVAKTISSVLSLCQNQGLDPYYVNGDIYGKGNEQTPARAYYKAYKEIKEQIGDKKLDYIFLAVGTGMTLAGLQAGHDEVGGSEKIVGISVARNKDLSTKATMEYYKSLLGKETATIDIDDTWLNGGYGKTSYDELATIRNMYCTNGILLDPVYTGKAFWGMKRYLVKHDIHNNNILFIHSGGLPLAFDQLHELGWGDSFRRLEFNERDVNLLSKCLKRNSNQFATSLDQVTDIDQYSRKILEKGYAFGYLENSEVLGVICGYANDRATRIAYESVLVTSPSVRGTGVASVLFELQFEYCKSMGMSKIQFTTDQRNIAAKRFYEKELVEIDREKTNNQLVYYNMSI